MPPGPSSPSAPVRPRVLIAGGGGREAAFAQKLAEDASVCAFLSHRNPSVVDCVAATGGRFALGDVEDAQAICRFAREAGADYAFINADGPLAAGVVDALLAAGIPAAGAARAAARIEWDKAYAIEMLQRIAPEATPAFEVIGQPAQLGPALRRFERAGLEVVVKPQGLTGGKGVKVMGEHLADYAACADYAGQLLARAPGGKALLVEKLRGVEFTIMGLTDGRDLVLPPASYDYPYRYDGDTGPGTGGMGCFTDAAPALPFLTDADLRACESVMRRTLDALAAEGAPFNGVLNGGFFKTPGGIRFMEFNSRFGDPEGLNILSILEGSFASVVEAMCRGRLAEAEFGFAPRASVIKYLVAPEYPRARAAPLEFRMDLEGLARDDVRVFFGACERAGPDDPGRYRAAGSSRAVALGATGAAIPEAAERINRAMVRRIKGPLEFRRDIGTQADIDRLMRMSRASPRPPAAQAALPRNGPPAP